MLNQDNIRLEPCDVFAGDYQVSKVTAAPDIASSHNNDYFNLYSGLDETQYYVWFNVNAAGVDPAPGGTGIEVAIGVGATAVQVAAAIKTAVDAVADFFASVSGAIVTIKNAQPGLSTVVSSGVGLVGFVYATPTLGSLDDLGLLDGDIEVTFDEKLLDITAHQTGADILASLRQGKIASIKLTLQETSTSQMQKVFKQAGSSYTPMGGTEVVGWGDATNSLNVVNQAQKLILHPHALDDADLSRDLAFWLAYLSPQSIKFSGEKPLLVECEFKTYTDTKRTGEVNQFVYGDHEQATYKA